ncbi:MAG: acyl carrier protein [Sneathiella sp.]|nr:acyl carrier protein [Sneathiella sp.]
MTVQFTQAAINHLSGILNCAPSDISPDDTIETVEKWDSLNHMRLILAIEENLNAQIESDDIMSLFTIKGIADYLEKTSA